MGGLSKAQQSDTGAEEDTERASHLLPRTFQVRSRGCVFCELSQARQATFLQPTWRMEEGMDE
jgi:hypothetical protein